MSVSSEKEHVDLYRAVQHLSEQVDAAIVKENPPAAERPTFRKSKQKQRAAALAALDPERAWVNPATLRGRLLKTLDAALTDNLSQHAPQSHHSTPLIFAESLFHKLKRVSGQSKLVPSDTNFEEIMRGEGSRRLLEDASGSINRMRRSNSRLPSLDAARTLLTRAAEASNRTEDEATTEHICALLFAGSAALPQHVNEVSDIVNKASTYKPQFDVGEGKIGGPKQRAECAIVASTSTLGWKENYFSN
ncbi:hypothetical protein T484DRAFT_1812106 [Baffinella frigidus]|nr:hypothetical protein T484DRAFT_1812106 [Cryptophyta sp. CCMP2293]